MEREETNITRFMSKLCEKNENINFHYRSSLVVQQVKDPALSLQWFGSLLWCEFDTWPMNFHVPQVWQKKKKKKKKIEKNKEWCGAQKKMNYEYNFHSKALNK